MRTRVDQQLHWRLASIDAHRAQTTQGAVQGAPRQECAAQAWPAPVATGLRQAPDTGLRYKAAVVPSFGTLTEDTVKLSPVCWKSLAHPAPWLLQGKSFVFLVGTAACNMYKVTYEPHTNK